MRLTHAQGSAQSTGADNECITCMLTRITDVHASMPMLNEADGIA